MGRRSGWLGVAAVLAAGVGCGGESLGGRVPTASGTGGSAGTGGSTGTMTGPPAPPLPPPGTTGGLGRGFRDMDLW